MSGSFAINAAVVVALLGTSAALNCSRAHAEVLSPRWGGFASCTLTTTDPNGDYYDQQIDTWTLLPASQTQYGAQLRYSATWAVTGGGHKNGNGSWTTRGGGALANLSFYVGPDMLLHIGINSAQLEDPKGMTLSNGMTSAIWEWQFPEINTTAGSLVNIGPTAPAAANGRLAYQEPGTAATTYTCTFKFQFGPVVVPPGPPPTRPVIPRRQL
jgi:hypothetical protein